MSVKLLFNNIKSKANCPCCGNSEEECICVTLEQLGATELELDFAIAGKYAGITYVSSSVTYSYNSKTWQTITNNFSSSVLTSYNTKMAELGRVNATNLGTDYYGRFINSSTCCIYWNKTDYGNPNIAKLNELLALTDEQLEQLKTYGKCHTSICSLCGGKELICTCITVEADDRLIDWAIAGVYIGATSSNVNWNTSSGTNYSMGGNIGKVLMAQLYLYNTYTSSVITKFEEKMNELGHYPCNPSNGTCDYYIGKSSSSPKFMRFCWNSTLYGTPNTTLLKQLILLTEEQLLQIKMYGKYCQ